MNPTKGALIAGLVAMAANAAAGKKRRRGAVNRPAKWRRVRKSPHHAPRKVRIA